MKKRISITLLVTLLLLISMSASAEDNSQALYESYCVEIANMYEIQPELIEAMCFCESSWNPKAESSSGCIGLMQIYPKYHKDRMERLGVTDLTDPYQNILVGTDYIAEIADEYEDLYDVLSIYNSGSTGLVDYPKKVTEKAHELEIEHYGL